jgi:hypothetical protein
VVSTQYGVQREATPDAFEKTSSNSLWWFSIVRTVSAVAGNFFKVG